MGVNPKYRLYRVGFAIEAERKKGKNTDRGFASLRMLNSKGVRGERRGFPEFFFGLKGISWCLRCFQLVRSNLEWIWFASLSVASF